MLKNLRISLFLAYKSITRGRKSVAVSLIAIMAVVSILLAFISGILLGVTETFNRQTIENAYGNIVIEPGEDEDYIVRAPLWQRKINSIPGVTASAIHYRLGAEFSYDEDKDGKDVKTALWTVDSIDPEEEVKVTKIHQAMVAGEYLDKSDRQKIVLGREISGGYGALLELESLEGVKVGDEITLTFMNGVQRDYEVKGIFSTKYAFADLRAFITEKEMESVLGVHDRASEIIVRIEQTGQEERYIQELRTMGLVEERIHPWTEHLGILSAVVESVGKIRLMISGFALLVAALVIYVIIFIDVTHKRKQIGILKALGVGQGTLINSYILQSLFYAVLGIGLGLAVIHFLLIPYFLQYPLTFPVGFVFLVVTKDLLIVNGLILFVVAVIGGLIPSWLAARENILKAIWGR
jgi:putative ABC transport system permease protein